MPLGRMQSMGRAAPPCLVCAWSLRQQWQHQAQGGEKLKTVMLAEKVPGRMKHTGWKSNCGQNWVQNTQLLAEHMLLLGLVQAVAIQTTKAEGGV